MVMSKHASIRSKNRSIAELALELLMEYGSQKHDHRGGTVLYFSKKIKKMLDLNMKYLGIGSCDNIKNCYLVESSYDGIIITVGHRLKRIHNV